MLAAFFSPLLDVSPQSAANPFIVSFRKEHNKPAPPLLPTLIAFTFFYLLARQVHLRYLSPDTSAGS